MNAEIYEMVIGLIKYDSSAASWRVAIALTAREFKKTPEEVEAICDQEYRAWAGSRGYDN
jgi:hypothetical protein